MIGTEAVAAGAVGAATGAVVGIGAMKLYEKCTVVKPLKGKAKALYDLVWRTYQERGIQERADAKGKGGGHYQCRIPTSQQLEQIANPKTKDSKPAEDTLCHLQFVAYLVENETLENWDEALNQNSPAYLQAREIISQALQYQQKDFSWIDKAFIKNDRCACDAYNVVLEETKDWAVHLTKSTVDKVSVEMLERRKALYEQLNAKHIFPPGNHPTVSMNKVLLRICEEVDTALKIFKTEINMRAIHEQIRAVSRSISGLAEAVGVFLSAAATTQSIPKNATFKCIKRQLESQGTLMGALLCWVTNRVKLCSADAVDTPNWKTENMPVWSRIRGMIATEPRALSIIQIIILEDEFLKSRNLTNGQRREELVINGQPTEQLQDKLRKDLGVNFFGTDDVNLTSVDQNRLGVLGRLRDHDGFLDLFVKAHGLIATILILDELHKVAAALSQSIGDEGVVQQYLREFNWLLMQSRHFMDQLSDVMSKLNTIAMATRKQMSEVKQNSQTKEEVEWINMHRGNTGGVFGHGMVKAKLTNVYSALRDLQAALDVNHSADALRNRFSIFFNTFKESFKGVLREDPQELVDL
ncbi:hypothetical protein HK102_004006 [Quaeritorhiza haematococci]|nr:hypothetical protein HK102_004006 [Quaeritorhiza haematococci]